MTGMAILAVETWTDGHLSLKDGSKYNSCQLGESAEIAKMDEGLLGQ